MRESRQTGPPILTARVLNNTGSNICSNFRRPVIRVAVNNNDLCGQVGRQISQNTPNRVCLIMGGNDYGYSHSDWQITTTGSLATVVTARRQRPISDQRAQPIIPATRPPGPAIP